jgi:alkylated DNA repair protein (DNA oxidative demethylase)
MPTAQPGSDPELNTPEGFRRLAEFLSTAAQAELVQALDMVMAEAPLYVPTMPHSGKPMSVRMTNCGSLGWVTDQRGGYRYQGTHPVTGRAWPPIPAQLIGIWREVAGHPALPDACLINFYSGSARMGAHRDADEVDFTVPVVSVSLGDDAVFHVGGLRRGDPKVRMILRSGDVVVLGGAARLAYHGIDRVLAGTSGLLPGGGRINLTLRCAGPQPRPGQPA